jgi:hypothetical protein
MVVRQLVREALVNSLVRHKHHQSMQVSSWTVSDNGYSTALKHEMIWGSGSSELLRLPFSRKYVIVFRAVEVIGVVLFALMVSLLTYQLAGFYG